MQISITLIGLLLVGVAAIIVYNSCMRVRNAVNSGASSGTYRKKVSNNSSTYADSAFHSGTPTRDTLADTPGATDFPSKHGGDIELRKGSLK